MHWTPCKHATSFTTLNHHHSRIRRSVLTNDRPQKLLQSSPIWTAATVNPSYPTRSDKLFCCSCGECAVRLSLCTLVECPSVLLHWRAARRLVVALPVGRPTTVPSLPTHSGPLTRHRVPVPLPVLSHPTRSLTLRTSLHTWLCLCTCRCSASLCVRLSGR